VKSVVDFILRTQILDIFPPFFRYLEILFNINKNGLRNKKTRNEKHKCVKSLHDMALINAYIKRSFIPFSDIKFHEISIENSEVASKENLVESVAAKIHSAVLDA
jgi:hypothetical protein